MLASALTVVSVLGFVCAVAFGVQAWFFHRFEQQLLALPTVQGVLERFDIADVRDQTTNVAAGKWSGRTRRLDPRVSYRYRVNGVEYTSTRLSNWSQWQTIDWTPWAGPNARLREFAGRFKAGEAVTVHYRPADPAKAYLLIDTFGSRLTGALAAIGFVLGIGALLARNWVR